MFAGKGITVVQNWLSGVCKIAQGTRSLANWGTHLGILQHQLQVSKQLSPRCEVAAKSSFCNAVSLVLSARQQYYLFWIPGVFNTVYPMPPSVPPQSPSSCVLSCVPTNNKVLYLTSSLADFLSLGFQLKSIPWGTFLHPSGLCYTTSWISDLIPSLVCLRC